MGAGSEDADGAAWVVPPSCAALHRSLLDCHRRARDPLICRHLNLSLAQCVVSAACPRESDAVRSLCSSAGTKMKREQCQRAQISLSLCLESHQSPDE